MIFRMLTSSLPLLFLLFAAHALADEASIKVYPEEIISRPNRLGTGVCIEDVNHEIYGGIYSQMIFGESFQEPYQTPPSATFTPYQGNWTLQNGELSVGGQSEAKLISNHPAFSTGEFGVEVFLPGQSGGVAGLVFNVNNPRKGADNFIGYEVSLRSDPENVVLGRHRNNWEPIQTISHAVPRDRWIPLVVTVQDTKIDVSVDGKMVATYEDKDHPLQAGAVGLRTFFRNCRFRNLWVKSGDARQELSFGDIPETECASSMWTPFRTGSAKSEYGFETQKAFTGHQSQRMTFTAGEGSAGLVNRGLNHWGMNFVEGRPYEGYLWVRAESPAELTVTLRNGDGKTVHASQSLQVAAGDWQRLDFTLTPKGNDRSGSFGVLLTKPGSVVLGHAFLQPGDWGRFKGLPVRRDVVEGLIDEGITVMRYGGSMVNHPEYRWKKMIGPRDRRPPYCGTWYPYSSNGWGIVDFIQLCEAMDIPCIPAFHMDETPQDMADFIDYLQADANSEWGKRREADGHPAPFKQKVIQLGNEERVDEVYFKKFKAIAEAIWAKDPTMILTVGDFVYSQKIADPMHFSGAASGITSFAAQQQIMKLAKTHNAEVWFDIHLATDRFRADDLMAFESVQAAFDALSDGANWKLAVFELNSNIHNQLRALANAVAIGMAHRNGKLAVVCSANGLQPDKQNDNDWNQGLLFLNSSQVWLQPPGYVHQMISKSYLPCCVRAETESPDQCFDVTVMRDDAGKVLLLRVVNLKPSPVATRLSLGGFSPKKDTAHVVTLAADLSAANTAESPKQVTPVETQWKHDAGSGGMTYTFPGNSLSILRFE
jgi:alpha-L-arabinofuranosidase